MVTLDIEEYIGWQEPLKNDFMGECTATYSVLPGWYLRHSFKDARLIQQAALDLLEAIDCSDSHPIFSMSYNILDLHILAPHNQRIPTPGDSIPSHLDSAATTSFHQNNGIISLPTFPRARRRTSAPSLEGSCLPRRPSSPRSILHHGTPTQRFCCYLLPH